jgi:hypothetical protein
MSSAEAASKAPVQGSSTAPVAKTRITILPSENIKEKQVEKKAYFF